MTIILHNRQSVYKHIFLQKKKTAVLITASVSPNRTILQSQIRVCRSNSSDRNVLVHPQGLCSLADTSLPSCASPFGRLGPLLTCQPTGLACFTVAPFRVRAPFDSTQRKTMPKGHRFLLWYTHRGSNPGHPD